MSSNRIPRNYGPLVSLATDALDGAKTHGATIKLAQNTASAIRADLVALVGDPEPTPPVVGKQDLLNLAKAARTASAATQRTTESNTRRFTATVINVLKARLGQQWSGAWTAAGFAGGSLAIPDDPLPLLGQCGAYFTAHPAHESKDLEVTGATVAAQVKALSAARSAANAATAAVGVAKGERDTALEALYQRLSGLRGELDQLLKNDDPVWFAFGFDLPAGGEQPAPVTGLVVTPGGPGRLFLDWNDARRAERYRVTGVVVGVGGQPDTALPAVSTTESESFLQGLPSGATVKLTVAAVNDAGDGDPAETGPVVVP